MSKKQVNEIKRLKIKPNPHSKPGNFYGEGYYLRGEGSNYGLKNKNGEYLFTPYDEESYLPRKRQLAKFIETLYKPKRALVLGCARGYLVKSLRELGVDAIGVDISEWAIQNAPEDVKPYLYVGDVCDLSEFKDSEFDLIVALDVLEHIKVPGLYNVLDSIQRLTSKALIIDIPLSRNGKDDNPDQSSGSDKSHVSVYSEKWWLKQLTDTRSFVLDGKDVYEYPDGSVGGTFTFRQKKSVAAYNVECEVNETLYVLGSDVYNKEIGEYTQKGCEKQVVKSPDLVDVIILNYNNLKTIVMCIESLYANTNHPFRLIVVDNQSTDGSAAWLDFARNAYPRMQVVFNDVLDSGFSAGVNVGLKQVKAPYILLLNSDTVIPKRNKQWLTEMIQELKADKQLGIVSPKLLYPPRNVNDKIDRIQYAGATFNKDIQSFHIGRFKTDDNFNEARLIPTATFACVLIRKSLINLIGGLDEDYKMGTFEDVDFCARTIFNGFKIKYLPSIKLYHYEGATQFTRLQDHFLLQQQLNARLFAIRWSAWIKLHRNAYPDLYAENPMKVQ